MGKQIFLTIALVFEKSFFDKKETSIKKNKTTNEAPIDIDITVVFIILGNDRFNITNATDNTIVRKNVFQMLIKLLSAISFSLLDAERAIFKHLNSLNM